ncbi:AraC family transcriptional regulator N-terminal domain-containing protein [Nocardioides kongjuensis]|uniref:AraC-like DNA-binding protein n=1 Tax=Nocardioides kongjuensis TaxID=349522 RepID=A0A852RDY0_9ACTN|nr:AraC family transcriptional regulator [Nocardioides kongjuensis]NYD28958.1 AraC-like DNA-binding protein [Nocardioides kongjuensis]
MPQHTAALDELRDLVARHARPDQGTAIDGLLLARADAAEAPSTSPSGTVLALIVQGSKRVSVGEKVLEYGPGQYLVASVDVPITGHYVDVDASRPALGVGLVLTPASIAELLLAAPPGAVPVRGSDAPLALGVADATPELLDATARMVRLLDRAHDRAILAPMIQREILWRVLTGPLGPSLAQIGIADSCTTQISRAVRWITDNFAEPFRVDELAASCGLSPSAFHRKFQGVTASSPIQFQKQVRLHQARLLLVSGDDDVATIAHRVGYDSATQFSREYRRRFGESPGRDGARLRNHAGRTA